MHDTRVDNDNCLSDMHIKQVHSATPTVTLLLYCNNKSHRYYSKDSWYINNDNLISSHILWFMTIFKLWLQEKYPGLE